MSVAADPTRDNGALVTIEGGGPAPTERFSVAASGYNPDVFDNVQQTPMLTPTITSIDDIHMVQFYLGMDSSGTLVGTTSAAPFNATVAAPELAAGADLPVYTAIITYGTNQTMTARTTAVTRAKRQPGNARVSALMPDAGVHLFRTADIENGSAGALGATASADANGWTLNPNSPHGISVTIAGSTITSLSQEFMISAPSGAGDTPNPTSITATQALTYINSVRFGNFTGTSISAAQLNDLTNWSTISGANTDALVNAGSWTVSTVAGDYIYIAVPTALVTGNTVLFSANMQRVQFASSEITTVGDYTLYRATRPQAVAQQLTWTINIS